MFELKKNTIEDKRSIIYQNLKLSFKPEGDFDWIYLIDFDDTYAYFEVYDYEHGAYLNFRVAYQFTGTLATFEGDPEEVVRLSEYKLVSTNEDVVTEKSLMKTLDSFFTKHFGSSKENSGLPVIKQFQEEKMVAIENLYILPNDIDGQGYTIDLEETHSLVKSFNEANDSGILQTSLFHTHKTESFEVVKAWVNPCECMIGDTLVEEGQPLVEIQFLNKAAWELRKEGTLMGLSIGAQATEVVEVDLDD